MTAFRQLKGMLQAQAHLVGVDLFGIADLTEPRVHKYIKKQGGAHLASFPTAVSLGIRLLDPVVDEVLNNPHGKGSVLTYHSHCYNTINPALERAAFLVSLYLQREGHQALPIPASQTLNSTSLEAAFSHKLAAHLGGLGWIGKNCLLITPQFGPRVRFITIFTNAQLPTDQPLGQNCGDCQICIETCPSKALKGVVFHPNHAREVRFDADLCVSYTKSRKDQWQQERFSGTFCGQCVAICPHGR